MGLGGCGLLGVGTALGRSEITGAAPNAQSVDGHSFTDLDVLEEFIDELMVDRIGDETPGRSSPSLRVMTRS